MAKKRVVLISNTEQNDSTEPELGPSEQFSEDNLSDMDDNNINNADSTIKDVVDDIKDHSEDTRNENEYAEAEIIDDDDSDNKFKSQGIDNGSGIQISGELFLKMIDIGVPMLIKMGIKLTDKGKEVDIQKLKLDYEEKQLMGPSADAVAKILFEKLTPIQQFFLGLGVIYSAKIPDAISDKVKQ